VYFRDMQVRNGSRVRPLLNQKSDAYDAMKTDYPRTIGTFLRNNVSKVRLM